MYEYEIIPFLYIPQFSTIPHKQPELYASMEHEGQGSSKYVHGKQPWSPLHHCPPSWAETLTPQWAFSQSLPLDRNLTQPLCLLTPQRCRIINSPSTCSVLHPSPGPIGGCSTLHYMSCDDGTTGIGACLHADYYILYLVWGILTAVQMLNHLIFITAQEIGPSLCPLHIRRNWGTGYPPPVAASTWNQEPRVYSSHTALWGSVGYHSLANEKRVLRLFRPRRSNSKAMFFSIVPVCLLGFACSPEPGLMPSCLTFLMKSQGQTHCFFASILQSVKCCHVHLEKEKKHGLLSQVNLASNLKSWSWLSDLISVSLHYLFINVGRVITHTHVWSSG